MSQLRYLAARRAGMRVGGLLAPFREEGQTLVEYALILVLIAIVVIVVLTVLGGSISSVFASASDSL